ncbi:Disease resistance protein RPS2 [Vitis vinifera]|uniref:Disease resistance protein RPS2 n=1 Tax=Vitis vinifera TaxID=29760 RepID=A0A438FW98_VITVI|nr:Disease resistance protein RPS2 [Vitis vinifera]
MTPVDTSKMYSEIITLLDHSMDDIEAYVPPEVINKMCKKSLAVDTTATIHTKETRSDSKVEQGKKGTIHRHSAVKQGEEASAQHGNIIFVPEKICNLAVDFAINQISRDIENPEVLRIGISGRDAIRVTSQLKNLPQIRKMFHVVVQVRASSYSTIADIEKHIAAQSGNSTLSRQEVDKLLRGTNFLIIVDYIHESINMSHVGTNWWNSKNIQKIVSTTRLQKAHRRMTVDLEIRMEDHLLSWKLFCMNVGKVVRSSHIQGVAIDVVERCCGHLLAIVLMGRALKEVNDVSIWKHASHALCVCPTSQMKDSILFNALAFICEQLGSKTNCVKHCALNMDKEGMDKVHLIQRWIKDGLIGTVGEGEVIVEDLLNAFLLESSQNGVSVRMRDEIREELGNLFGPKLNPPVLNLGGKGLTMPPNDEAWEEAGEICLMNNELFELPDSPNCPQLRVLLLQANPFLTVPPEVGELSNLEVLDFEGTEIISLPMDVGKLSKLTCLKLSFYGEDRDERKNNRSTSIIPHNVIGKLLQLEELSIDVNPDDERWNGIVKNIIKEVCSLKELKVLKLYLPEIVLLNDFMWNEIPFLSLSRFSFIVGGHLKCIISRLPRETTFEFKKQKRCLKYVNGEDIPVEIKEVLQHATALFLDRHLTLTKLSEFGIENMKKLEVCVLGECKEIQTLVDGAEINKQEDNARDVNEDTVLGSLQYLSIHYMKNLRSFWKGPVQKGCLSSLKSLALHTCPQLTTIFTLDLLENLNILEELVIENCPKINSLVTHELPAEEIQLCSIEHLPKLKKISLHYMHELVSISSGLCIAPKVEWMSFYGCPNLKTLSPMDVSSSNLKGIIGEVDWWNELTGNVQPENLDSIFVPVEGATELMNQLQKLVISFSTEAKEKPSQHPVSKRNKPVFCSTEKHFPPNMFSSSTCTTSAIESVNVGNLIYHLIGCINFSKIGIRLRRLPEQVPLFAGKRNEVATLWTGS